MGIQALIDTLEEMNEQHSTMLELGKRKKKAIIVNNIDELTAIMCRENRFVEVIKEFEVKREQVIREFLFEKGIKSDLKLSITELTRLVFNPNDKVRLQESQKKLANTLIELKRVNQLNQDLIKQAISFVEYSMNLMLPDEQDVIYQNPMNAYSMKRQSFFNTRA